MSTELVKIKLQDTVYVVHVTQAIQSGQRLKDIADSLGWQISFLKRYIKHHKIPPRELPLNTTYEHVEILKQLLQENPYITNKELMQQLKLTRANLNRMFKYLERHEHICKDELKNKALATTRPRLSDKQRQILAYHREHPTQTMAAIGRHVGVSREYVRQTLEKVKIRVKTKAS